jgi:WD40 repeat protein
MPWGTLVATTAENQGMTVWNGDDGAILGQLHEITNSVTAAGLDRSAAFLAVGDSSGTVGVWSTKDWTRALASWREDPVEVRSLAFHPEDRVLAVARGNAVAIRDMATGRLRVLLGPPHDHRVLFVQFDATGRRLLSAGRDGRAIVWDWRRGLLICELLGHAGAVILARFSPDGNFVATAGDDGTALLWDAVEGRELRILRGHSGALISVAWGKAEDRLLTAGRDGLALLHETGEFGNLETATARALQRIGRPLSADERRIHIEGP